MGNMFERKIMHRRVNVFPHPEQRSSLTLGQLYLFDNTETQKEKDCIQ